MADIIYAPSTSGHPSSPHSPLSTLRRVGRAWAALAARRRRLVIAGTVAVLGLGAAASSVVALPLATGVVLVGLLAAAAAVVDQHEQRIPNTLLTTALATVMVVAALESRWTVVAVLVSLTMAAFPLWAVRYGRGLGLGDVKLAAVLGAAVGLVHPFAGLAVVWCAAVASGIFALTTRRNRLVLGPWLWAGYVAAGSAAIVFVHVLERGGHTWPARF